MDDYNENAGLLYIIIVVTGSIMILFIISYYNLYRFRECYNAHFKYNYCEKYKDF